MVLVWPMLKLMLLGLTLTGLVWKTFTVMLKLAQLEEFWAQTVTVVNPEFKALINNVLPDTLTDATKELELLETNKLCPVLLKIVTVVFVLGFTLTLLGLKLIEPEFVVPETVTLMSAQ